jgi:hypothetical protein
MDQGAGNITKDLADIDQSREAIAHKLGLLEHRVQDTVEAAKTTVSDVIENMQDATGNVLANVEDFVEKTKEAFNPNRINERPWLLLGGAILLGYALGRPERGRSADFGSKGFRPVRRKQPNLWDGLADQIQEEIEFLRGAVIQIGRSLLHDMLTKAPAALAESLQAGSRADSRSRQQAPDDSAYGSGSDFSPEFPRSH